MLSHFVNSKKNDWDDLLDMVCFAHNTSVWNSGYSPYEIIYGRKAKEPADILFGKLSDLDVSKNFRPSKFGN